MVKSVYVTGQKLTNANDLSMVFYSYYYKLFIAKIFNYYKTYIRCNMLRRNNCQFVIKVTLTTFRYMFFSKYKIIFKIIHSPQQSY